MSSSYDGRSSLPQCGGAVSPATVAPLHPSATTGLAKGRYNTRALNPGASSPQPTPKGGSRAQPSAPRYLELSGDGGPAPAARPTLALGNKHFHFLSPLSSPAAGRRAERRPRLLPFPLAGVVHPAGAPPVVAHDWPTGTHTLGAAPPPDLGAGRVLERSVAARGGDWSAFLRLFLVVLGPRPSAGHLRAPPVRLRGDSLRLSLLSPPCS